MQNRPIEKIYPMVFLDAIHYHVRESNIVVKKAVYIALGYNLEGFKEILSMWVRENESSKYWLLVLNDLKERGLEAQSRKYAYEIKKYQELKNFRKYERGIAPLFLC